MEQPESHLLDVDPILLSLPPSERPVGTSYKGPRLAKTAEHCREIQRWWRKELYDKKGIGPTSEDRMAVSSIGRMHTYKAKLGSDEETTFYGHVIRPRCTDGTDGEKKQLLPGVIFFHTGGGPRDLYFHWKADELAMGSHPLLKGCKCVVFIADFTSDERGWGWDNDKSKYNSFRKDLLAIDANGRREALQERIRLGIDTLKGLDGVDSNNIAALGWCLGGQSIAEMVRMKIPGVRAMASYHCVLDGLKDTKLEEAQTNTVIPVEGGDCCNQTSSNGDATKSPPSAVSKKRKVSESQARALICVGAEDPFITHDDLLFLRKLMTSADVQWSLLEFSGVKHGFTTPGSIHNPHPAFGFCESATQTSMDATARMIRECCFNE